MNLRLKTLAAALLVVACGLPTKDELPGTGSSGTTAGEATGGTTPTGSSGVDVTEGVTGSGGVDSASSGGAECAALTEAECEAAPECAPRHGLAFAFDGCPEGQVYLGCGVEMACDAALTTACRDGTDEVYQLSSGCLPPGFTACETDLGLCAGVCLGLDEAACAAARGCKSIFGNPHVVDGGGLCVDDKSPQFLACDVDTGACPPFVPTVCPEGQPDQRFDVPSGCIPPGFMDCEGGGTPACP